ncbi:ADP-ribosylglycohydrolase family protein [Anoxynatronum sibiricum]|uniref:ADP-ribosylglycohydrolase family protein n=1 Tax=Anoxynatronum sibiricum TaxID=210623 RepID=A0ABU9VYN2_9CLOT
MLGAIIGDIVGSRFERHNHKSKDFDLFHPDCSVTDDSIMSLAIAKALSECGKDYDNLGQLAVKNMQELGRQYPNCGFGAWFYSWVHSDNPQPYNSFGNGAAMRVSACGLAANSLEMAKYLSLKVTEVTHNHPEGLKGAEATVVAGYMAKNGCSKLEIREYIEKHYYPLDFTLEEIRQAYRFDVTCQGTVPQAIVAFLEADSFEDAIRNAISIGGDSDTIGAITGGIAGAFYSIPGKLREQALTYMDEELQGILKAFEVEYHDVSDPEKEEE